MESMNDIIAGMRSVAFSMKVHDAMMPEVYDILCGVAFRLEAAWKREKADAESDALAVGGIVEAARTTEKSSAVGNAAAMREALEGMCKASQDVFRSFARETFAGERRLDSLGRAFDKAQAALSAPARNCDRFGTDNTEAELAYEEYCEKSEIDESITGAFEWLFAFVTEKGANDGSK